MAKAHRVPGIRPKHSMRENAIRVIEVRLGELLGWRGALDDASRIEELHDMRIAAKRLRYALEMFDVCFSGSKPLLKELTAMQDDLGAIHDLDVLAGVLRTRLAPLDHALEEEATHIMAGRDTADAVEQGRAIRRLLSQAARDRERIGLVGLLGDAVARRRSRYAAVQQRYSGPYLDDLEDRIRSETRPHPARLSR